MNYSVFDLVEITSSVVTAIATVFAAAGVWYAREQLQASREIFQLQFEDALDKEYRELISKLPAKAVIGEPLTDLEYEDTFDEIFQYIDLSNQQVNLRCRKRISKEIWEDWAEGIESNLKLPAISRAWTEIKNKSSSFQELRRFEASLGSDPYEWNLALSPQQVRSRSIN